MRRAGNTKHILALFRKSGPSCVYEPLKVPDYVAVVLIALFGVFVEAYKYSSVFSPCG